MSIRVAVIGFGLAGRVFHAPFVAAVPGLELAAIVQRRGDEAAAAYPGVPVLRSVDEALADPTIDMVVVGTPNDTHFDMVSRALQAGKHVVVDKPFATSSQDALKLIAMGEESGKVLAPFHNRRHDCDFLTVRKLIEDGTLGRIATISAAYDRFRPLRRPGTWKESNGPLNGILFDLGPHLVDQALALFGPPDTVMASCRTDREDTEIDDAFDIYFTWNGNDEGDSETPLHRVYSCHASMLAADPAPRFSVRGTHGAYTKYGVDPQEAALLGGAKPPVMGSQEPWLPEAESAWGTVTLATQRTEPVKLERKPYPTVTGDYRDFYANLRDTILGKATLEVLPRDGYRAVRLLELAREASERGATLPVKFEV